MKLSYQPRGMVAQNTNPVDMLKIKSVLFFNPLKLAD